jgi:hypothetical protein
VDVTRANVPEQSRDLYRRARHVLAEVCARLQLDPRGAELLRLHSNAVFRLPAGLIVRIRIGPDGYTRVLTSVQVTAWLAERGFPTVRPASVAGQPWRIEGAVVSLWQYVHAAPGPAPTAAELGRLLRELHQQPRPPFGLPASRDPFAGIAEAIENIPDALAPADRDWLTQYISEVRDAWSLLRYPLEPGLIHGDPHQGNLLRATDGRAVLFDWDSTCQGHREWDLIQLVTRSRCDRLNLCIEMTMITPVMTRFVCHFDT